jgi:hypothetical protein
MLGANLKAIVSRKCDAAAGLRFFDNLFDLRDFLLDFAGDFFEDAVGFEAGIFGELAHLALDGAFDFVECTFG